MSRSKSPFRESDGMVIDEEGEDEESDYDNDKDKKTQNPSLSPGNSLSNKRKKKTRTVFSRSQVFQLESTFDMKRYLSSSERAGLAASLHLTETQVDTFLILRQTTKTDNNNTHDHQSSHSSNH